MAFDEGEENRLIGLAAAGDAEAFSALFHHYYSMIYSFAYRLCFDKDDAQDVAQETFLKAARALAGFQRKSSFKHWLYRIALNASHDQNRALTRRKNTTEAYLEQSSLAERPTDHVEIHEALKLLPDEWRQTVALVYFEGLNHAEAARVMDCAETTISWRLFMAKRRLKKQLGGGK